MPSFALDAWAPVDTNFVTGKTVLTLRGAAYRTLLRPLALLTFNLRHFDPPPAGVTVIEPRL